MKNLLFLLLLCFSATLFAQDTTKAVGGKPGNTADTVKPGRLKPAGSRDTVKPSRKRPGLFLEREKPERRKFDSTLFTENAAVTPGDYLEDMEKVFQMLNAVAGITSSFIHLPEIREKLYDQDSTLDILKERVLQNDRTLNIRNLQMFNTLLDALDKSITGYSGYLEDYDTTMDNVQKDIANLRKDTLMLHIFRDSALKASFMPQLLQLRDKWRLVDSLDKTNTGEIGELKARAIH